MAQPGGGKKCALLLSCLGLLGSAVTLTIGFFPPANINVGAHWHYVTLFAGGILIMTSPALLLKAYNRLAVGT